jgi:hypothetical protein
MTGQAASPPRRTARIPIASIAGLLFLAAWLAAAMVLADRVRGLHPAIQFCYYAVAGFVWVFPVRWLMLWAAGQR